MYKSTILTALVAMLAAVATAAPSLSNGAAKRGNTNGDLCSGDSDCPSDYPYCICAYNAPGSQGTWMQVYECSNENCDGCLDEC